MCQLTFGGDGVKALLASVGSANEPETKPTCRFLCHKCCYRNETQTVESEDVEHSRIFTLTDQTRPDTVGLKPLLDGPAQSGVRHRQQRRRAILRFGETEP